MAKCLVVIGLLLAAVFAQEEISRKPVYKYRYETEDLMKTAASSVPIRGYHVVEGGYYPSELGAAGIGGIGGIGGGGIGGGGIGYGGGQIGGYSGGGQIGGYGGQIGIGGGGGGIGGIGGGIGGAGLGLGIGGAGIKSIGYGGGIGGGQFIGGGGGQLIGGGGQFIGGGGGQLIGGGGGQLIGGGGGQFIGGGGQFIGGGGGGAGGIGGGQFIGGGPLHHHGYGGEYVDKNVFSGEKKNLNDEKYEKANGQQGQEFNAGKEGYNKGVAAVKNNKGESGYVNNQQQVKKANEDGKTYYGGQHFDKEGKQGGQLNEKSGHKKGHVIKGYKTSHHKDESGKTEEFYDEANDEGGKVNFNGQSGSFGEKGASSFKGGHENGEFAAGGQKKQSHFDNQHLIDNSNADQGKYGEKKYGGSGSVYGVNNGVDQQSLLGHQEANRFYKHHPYHVPFY